MDKLLEPYVQATLTADNPTFKQSNLITAPEPEAQDRIEEMEQELVKDLPELEFIAPEEQNFGVTQPDSNQKDIDTSSADPEPDEQDDDDDESFFSMLKKTGII